MIIRTAVLEVVCWIPCLQIITWLKILSVAQGSPVPTQQGYPDVLSYSYILGYPGIPWCPQISWYPLIYSDILVSTDILGYPGILWHPSISWYLLISSDILVSHEMPKMSSYLPTTDPISFLHQPNEVKHLDRANFWHKHATKIRHTILEMAEETFKYRLDGWLVVAEAVAATDRFP